MKKTHESMNALLISTDQTNQIAKVKIKEIFCKKGHRAEFNQIIILGEIESGIININQEMKLQKDKEEINSLKINSIQIMDVETNIAFPGFLVGICIEGTDKRTLKLIGFKM